MGVGTRFPNSGEGNTEKWKALVVFEIVMTIETEGTHCFDLGHPVILTPHSVIMGFASDLLDDQALHVVNSVSPLVEVFDDKRTRVAYYVRSVLIKSLFQFVLGLSDI